MNRFEFASSIKYPDSSQEEVVGHHFDKVMTLYELIQPVCAHVTAHTNNELQFNILPIFGEDTDKIIARLQNQHITNYGIIYTINSIKNENGIFVELVEKV